MTTVIGVDPGLVCTGIVMLHIRVDYTTRYRTTASDKDAAGVVEEIFYLRNIHKDPCYIFIEQYKPRSHFGTDAQMLQLVRDIKDGTGGKVLNNTGSKQVVRPALMQKIFYNGFPTTHHQDLQAAARILLYGMLKTPSLNDLLVRALEKKGVI